MESFTGTPSKRFEGICRNCQYSRFREERRVRGLLQAGPTCHPLGDIAEGNRGLAERFFDYQGADFAEAGSKARTWSGSPSWSRIGTSYLVEVAIGQSPSHETDSVLRHIKPDTASGLKVTR